MEKNQIITGDCIDILRGGGIADKTIDLLCVDPPYEFISKNPQGGGFMKKENKKHLEELNESFGFECDEVGFWKREYKRLKKWIKDHCKGYGNLFPEDEMKRQWKKADKKRK